MGVSAIVELRTIHEIPKTEAVWFALSWIVFFFAGGNHQTSFRCGTCPTPGGTSAASKRVSRKIVGMLTAP
ncbi:MAG: hypothetical protein QOH71_1185 [Blastocatellia bacterium]|nr:hypothetical protein [Blastocatellia bacterium]